MDKYGFLIDDARCAMRRLDSNDTTASGSVGSGSAGDSRSSAAARSRDCDTKGLEELLDRMHHTSNRTSPGSQRYSNAQSRIKYSARRGFPDGLRRKAWTTLTDVNLLIHKHPGKYEGLADCAEDEWIMYDLERTVDEFQGNQTPTSRLRKSLSAIERDINRTFPKHFLFQSDGMDGKNQGTSERKEIEDKPQSSEGAHISDSIDWSDEEDDGENTEENLVDFSIDHIESMAECMGTDAASIVEEKRQIFTQSVSTSMRSLMNHLDKNTADITDEESGDDSTLPFSQFGGIQDSAWSNTLGEGEGREALRRVLRAYTLYDPDIGYCQGMNFIAAMFLTFLSENEAFWLLVVVMNNKPYKLRELFAEDMRGTHEVLYLAEKLLSQFLPKLSKHLEEEGIHISMFVTQWLLTVYTSTFPFDLVTHVWDAFLIEGWKPVYRVMLSLLDHGSNDMLAMRFEEILAYIKELPSTIGHGEVIMNRSLKFPLKRRHIQKYVTEWRKHAIGGGPSNEPNAKSPNAARDPKSLFTSKLSTDTSGTSKSDSTADSRLSSKPAIFINAPSLNKLCRPLRSSMLSRTLQESLDGDLRHKNSTQPGFKRSVSFSSASIRIYERILGDNPSVTSGPPISIGWRHVPGTISINIDDYEISKGEPRDSTAFLLDQPTRESIILKHTTISQREMVAAIKNIRKQKAQRLKTVVNLNMQKTEEKAESAKRKTQIMFNKSLSDETLEAKLWHDAHAKALEKAKILEERTQQGKSVSSRDLYSVGSPCLGIIPSRRNSG